MASIPPTVVRIEIATDDPDRTLLEMLERIHKREAKPSWLWSPRKRWRYEKRAAALDELRFTIKLRDALVRAAERGGAAHD